MIGRDCDCDIVTVTRGSDGGFISRLKLFASQKLVGPRPLGGPRPTTETFMFPRRNRHISLGSVSRSGFRFPKGAGVFFDFYFVEAAAMPTHGRTGRVGDVSLMCVQIRTERMISIQEFGGGDRPTSQWSRIFSFFSSRDAHCYYLPVPIIPGFQD